MINELKCPFCKRELKHEMTTGIYCCKSCFTDCPLGLGTGAFGTKELWQALTQAKQDLAIARKTLKEMQHWLGVIRCSTVSHLNNQNNTLLEHYETDPTVQNIDKAKSILKQYLEQIEHKD